MGQIAQPIVFFGTGPVAAKSLELLTKNFQIKAVITKPRPDHHKGPVPVLELAEKLQLTTLQVRNSAELDELITAKPDLTPLAVLIDFGIIISQQVIDYFPLGILNSHFSVLPDLRGADPITFAVLSGQKQTGVSLMMVVKAMDEGPIVGFGEYDMAADITTPQLTDDLIQLSDALLAHDIPRILSGEAKGVDQSVTKRKVSYSRRLTKQDGNLDWNKPAEQLEREVRAFLGWPGSNTVLGDKLVTVTKASIIPNEGKIGAFHKSKSSLAVQTSKDALSIERLKPAGKVEMDISSFLSGYGQNL